MCWFKLSPWVLGLFCLTLAARGEIVPAKTWFAASQPLTLTNTGSEPIELVLTDFLGTPRQPVRPGAIPPTKAVDLRERFGDLPVGTYLLYAVQPGQPSERFIGTPLVVGVRPADSPRGAAPVPMVIKVEPLRYAVMETDAGEIIVTFYYDVAPNTVDSFLTLSAGGFFDGLSFHRIVPGFVIQGGDPLETMEGGPGYTIDAEFNERPHLPGVFSMAREGDPIERQGAMPRSPAANSAGSQFFIALDYRTTRRLDGRYTVFGRAVEGLEVITRIGAAEIADPTRGKPRERQGIRKVRVEHVTSESNPYPRLQQLIAADAPSTRPVTRTATGKGG